MVLHPKPEDTSYRYIQRMQQAVRVLYGSASPSEALEAATLQLETIDLNEFLANIADNAHFAGLQDLQFERTKHPVVIRADEFSLEDVVTHILGNADRYRTAGTPIDIRLEPSETTVSVIIHNQGSSIAPAMLDRIFEYGVSDPDAPNSGEHRGQGLFVAKTYMAKMSGTISAQNVDDGVSFTFTLQRVNS
jgi:signal transduction histidine kinase